MCILYLSNVFNRRSPKKAVDESDEISILNETREKGERRDKNINHFSGSLLGICCFLSAFFLLFGVNRETFLRIFFLFVSCVTDFGFVNVIRCFMAESCV